MTTWLALTTTILAVFTAISTLLGGKNTTRMQLTATDQNNKWAYYQAKSIKQHTCEVARDIVQVEKLHIADSAVSASVQSLLDGYEKDIRRYDSEKAEIQKQALDLASKQAVAGRRSSNFTIAIVLMQLSIMLNSLSAMVKRKSTWIAGLALCMVGLLLLGNAICL